MNKPHVIINCAMSADGKIALPNGKQLRLSGEKDIERMYQLRHQSDAVLVGIGTILADDPKLTVKEKYVKNPSQPVRVILDTNCKTPENALAVNQKSQTWIIVNKKCNKNYGSNVEVINCEINKEGFIDLNILLKLLYHRGIKKILVEGGGTVIYEFLRQKMVDDLYVYIAPIIIGGENTPTMADGRGIKDIKDLINLEIADVHKLDSGLLIHYKMIS